MGIKDLKLKSNRMSIKWKLFTYLIGFCLFLLIILWLFQVLFLESFYKYTKINEIEKSAALVTENINDKNIMELAQDIASDNDVVIQFWTDDGKVINSSDKLKTSMIDGMIEDEKQEVIRDTIKNNGSQLVYYNKEGFSKRKVKKFLFETNVRDENNTYDETIIYSKILTDSDGNTVVLIISSIIKTVNATVDTIRMQLYYITVIMFLFAIILALVIAKRVARPIEKINESAKLLNKEQYKIEFTGSGYKEISELSDTLTVVAKELSKVEKLRRDLIANISHDLRTPLTLIEGYAELMRDLENENNPENAQIIIDEAKRLTTLVNDMLDISRFEGGVQSLNLTRFNITHTLNELITSINELVKKDGYKVTFIYENEIDITADKIKISQAFYNLLINAINYTGIEKEVNVKQIINEDNVKIEVIDTGDGIEAKDIPYIWDRYYKINKNHKRPVTGTGIGLSIVKKIIELHGGSYGVESEIGTGSTFWFMLKN